MTDIAGESNPQPVEQWWIREESQTGEQKWHGGYDDPEAVQRKAESLSRFDGERIFRIVYGQRGGIGLCTEEHYCGNWYPLNGSGWDDTPINREIQIPN
jgi:hypothetical protein